MQALFRHKCDNQSIKSNQSRVGKASRPDDIIGQSGEGKKNTDGIEMLRFLDNNNEMKALKHSSLKLGAQWTWTRICEDKRERSVLDYIVCLLYTSPSPRDS